MPFTATASNGTVYPLPLCFTPTQLAGFADYSRTYSEFRLLKAVCKVHLALPDDSAEGSNLSNNPYTYVRVASRPFVEYGATQAGNADNTGAAESGGSPSNITDILVRRVVTISALRESRWQKQYYPSDIKNSVSFKFYPYTLEWQGRPVGNYGTGAPEAYRFQYLKWKSGRQWMPMSFLGTASSMNQTNSPGDDVSFLGPYFVRLLSTQADSQALQSFTPVINLQVWCQFRGQK